MKDPYSRQLSQDLPSVHLSEPHVSILPNVDEPSARQRLVSFFKSSNKDPPSRNATSSEAPRNGKRMLMDIITPRPPLPHAADESPISTSSKSSYRTLSSPTTHVQPSNNPRFLGIPPVNNQRPSVQLDYPSITLSPPQREPALYHSSPTSPEPDSPMPLTPASHPYAFPSGGVRAVSEPIPVPALNTRHAHRTSRSHVPQYSSRHAKQDSVYERANMLCELEDLSTRVKRMELPSPQRDAEDRRSSCSLEPFASGFSGPRPGALTPTSITSATFSRHSYQSSKRRNDSTRLETSSAQYTSAWFDFDSLDRRSIARNSQDMEASTWLGTP